MLLLGYAVRGPAVFPAGSTCACTANPPTPAPPHHTRKTPPDLPARPSSPLHKRIHHHGANVVGIQAAGAIHPG